MFYKNTKSANNYCQPELCEQLVALFQAGPGKRENSGGTVLCDDHLVGPLIYPVLLTCVRHIRAPDE